MITNPMAQDRFARQPFWPGIAGSGENSRGALHRDHRSPLREFEDAATGGGANPHAAVAEILERAVTEPALLHGLRYAGSLDCYTRHLVYSGPGFSILAVVWLPGQMSPIHCHRSWCALGIRQGELVETCFTRDEGKDSAKASLRLDACRQLRPGMVSHSDGDDEHYHRVANLGVETAISIHVYGVAFDRLGHGLNRKWEE